VAIGSRRRSGADADSLATQRLGTLRANARVLRRWADRIEADVERLAPLKRFAPPAAACRGRTCRSPPRGCASSPNTATSSAARSLPLATTTGMVVAEPYGVVGASPWNFRW
jgi:aldehyde dehydrogenase (NAD+)